MLEFCPDEPSRSPTGRPFSVKPPKGVRIRTRLRVSDRDGLVLWALGLYLGGLANHDLALRCARGTAGGDGRTERKRALTEEASSRWAGALTRTSNDQWERGLLNLRDQQLGLQRAIASIQRRLGMPVGEPGGHCRGYASHFRHRGSEVATQAGAEPIRYDISYQPERGRWYLDASWRLPAGPLPELKGALSGGVLGVDLNAGHLAAWVLDRDGNPRSRSRTPRVVLETPRALTRDGRLRAAISGLVGLARQAGVKAIAIEDLDFVDARQPTPRNLRFRGDPGVGRETMGGGQRGKRWRRTVPGLPTAKFRHRLLQMCTNAGLRVVAVARWTVPNVHC